MSYPEFQQIIDTMVQANHPYTKDYQETLQRHRDRKAGKEFSLSEHIQGMVYSMLSNMREWDPVKEQLPKIDKLFSDYAEDYIRKPPSPDYFAEEIKKLGCGNISINSQMRALPGNIDTLKRIANDHGSIDKYFNETSRDDLLKDLALPTNAKKGEGKYKLDCMGIALVAEYLKNMGVDIVKPDRHLRRIIARWGRSNEYPAGEVETLDICREIAQGYGLTQIEVDSILWQYCASGERYFKCCADNARCGDCGVKDCWYKQKLVDFDIQNGVLVKYLGNDKHVVIPDSVTEIGYRAFRADEYAYGEAEKIYIPEGVKKIAAFAFCDNINLKEITLPSKLESIGDRAFSGCYSLKSIKIPDSVKELGEFVFDHCDRLESITIGKGLTKTGPLRIGGADSALKTIKVSRSNQKYYSDGNCLIERETGTLLNGCNSSVIPDGVKSIAPGAFMNCDGLEKIVIPDSVESIGEDAFGGCLSLQEVIIGANVTDIAPLAFESSGCRNGIVFLNPTGWTVTEYQRVNGSLQPVAGGMVLSLPKLIDPHINADYLKTTYRNFHWKRA
ncbi:MAG: leucine-rich repeat protein [Lachnospiraceae bacterium]|nr:leucine-rich repeat protein [Lachnospiraceae bacterium]